MAVLRHEDRLAIFEFAEKLSQLAADAPNLSCKRVAHKLAQRIRVFYGYTPNRRKAEIFARVCNGAASIPELIEETGFHKDEVYQLTRELADEGRIKFVKIASSGRGRPAIRVFAAG